MLASQKALHELLERARNADALRRVSAAVCRVSSVPDGCVSGPAANPHALLSNSDSAVCGLLRELMAKEELRRLGFQGASNGAGERTPAGTERGTPAASEAQEQRRRGFIAGLPDNDRRESKR